MSCAKSFPGLRSITSWWMCQTYMKHIFILVRKRSAVHLSPDKMQGFVRLHVYMKWDVEANLSKFWMFFVIISKKSWMNERWILFHFSHYKHDFGMEGNLAGLTVRLCDLASLHRTVMCHKDSLEVIYDLIFSSGL